MMLDFVPLLQVQRDLYALPRGMERFREYLRVLVNDAGNDLRLAPLVGMNPMAREHVPALLEELMALDADGVAARAAAEVAAELADAPGIYRVGLVVVDDLRGGWTNRFDVEFGLRFGGRAIRQRGWLSAALWSSEPASAESARLAVRSAAHRAAYVERHGPARTLRERLAQEGAVLRRADDPGPTLDPDDLDYTRAVLAPHLDADDKRTAIECLFGDAAARTLGFTPRGLSPGAGLALARHDAAARVGA